MIEAKKNQTPTVSPYLLDGVQSEQAKIGGFTFECAEAATDMEGIVPLEPGKGESIEGKSMEGASGMECVESHGGNDGNDPDDSLNNDETSIQSSVDSAVQDHSVVPDCSQHYIPEIIQINEENTIQEENEDFNTAVDIVMKALEYPFLQILENAGIENPDEFVHKICAEDAGYGYNVKTKEFGDMIKMGIIDPAKVTKSALKNAISVATTILSTSTIISNIRA